MIFSATSELSLELAAEIGLFGLFLRQQYGGLGFDDSFVAPARRQLLTESKTCPRTLLPVAAMDFNQRIARAAKRRGGLIAAAAMVLLVALGLGFGRDTALADPATERAAAFVAAIGEQAVALLAAGDIPTDRREVELGRLLEGGVDVASISRAALGRHWLDATGAQRAEFRELFARYVLGSYSRLLASLGLQSLTVLGAEKTHTKKPHVLVRTEARLAGGHVLEWIWRVHKTGQGYKIIDLTIAGVSMIVTQRDEFDAMVTAQGLDGLLAELRRRL